MANLVKGFGRRPGTAGGVPRGRRTKAAHVRTRGGWLDYGDLTEQVGLVAAPGGGILPLVVIITALRAVFEVSFELNWLLPEMDFGTPCVAGAANLAGCTAPAIVRS